MALLDIFKKKKKPVKEIPAQAKPKPKAPLKPKPVSKTKVSKTAQPKAPVKTKTKASAIAQPKASHSGGQAWRVLKQPHVTEKATVLTKQNQYIFKIWPRANKIEVKKAIEDLYGVNVKGVNIIKVPRKRRRLGRIRGWRKGYKKAIVKLQKGQKIEVLPR